MAKVQEDIYVGKQKYAFSVGALTGGLMAGVQASLPIDISVSRYEPLLG